MRRAQTVLARAVGALLVAALPLIPAGSAAAHHLGPTPPQSTGTEVGTVPGHPAEALLGAAGVAGGAYLLTLPVRRRKRGVPQGTPPGQSRGDQEDELPGEPAVTDGDPESAADTVTPAEPESSDGRETGQQAEEGSAEDTGPPAPPAPLAVPAVPAAPGQGAVPVERMSVETKEIHRNRYRRARIHH